MRKGVARNTTTCSGLVGLVLTLAAVLLDGGLSHARTVSEEELVQAFLRTAPEKAVGSAAHARQKAAGITRPYLPKPDLLLRQEQSFGSTELSTVVAGISLSLEIGGRHGLRKRAAALDAAAAGLQRQAEVVETLCDLRRRVVAAHEVQKIVELLSASQRRLERLPKNLKLLVSAGERAQFDLDRLLLLVRSHGQTLARHQARLKGLLAELSSLSGLTVTAVRLGSSAPTSAASGHGGINPAIRALRTQARAEAQRIAEVRRRWVPNLDLYGAYRLDVVSGATGHGYEVGLTLNLPITATERKVQASAEARRRSLLATATRRQALRSARLALLQSKAEDLKRTLSSDAGVLTKLVRDATRRYLTGVGPLSELVDTLRAVNEAALQRARTESALRRIALEAACLRGTFDDKNIKRLAREATQ